MTECLRKQLDFSLEVDKTKDIFRQTYISSGERKENDAEHAWHMALMAYLLREYANEEVDILKVIIMILIHDLVEIDAGDTYAFDAEANLDKREREVKAADRIFNILPEDQAKEIYDLWEEFEAYETPEAKFAHTLDNFQPLMLNNSIGGVSWREHGVKLSQILKRNSKTGEGSKEIWSYMREVIQDNIDEGNIIDDKKIED